MLLDQPATEFEVEEENEIIDINQQTSSSLLNTFLKNIESKINLNVSLEGDRLNGYYLPKFKTNLLRICKQFPLWSKVMMTYFNSPYTTATSASVEGDFSELKNKILKHEGKPMTVDRFVSIHIQSIQSSMKLARSHQLYSKSNEFDPNVDSFENSSNTIPHCSSRTSLNISSHVGLNNSPRSSLHSSSENSLHSSPQNSPHRSPVTIMRSNSLSSDHSSVQSNDTLNEEETWRGLKNSPMGPLLTDKKRKRQTKYMNPCPEIDRILNRSRMRSHKNTLIFNGNIASQCKIKSLIYIATNTCPFDSVVVAITVAYNDYPYYKLYIDQTENQFLSFAKKLAKGGATNVLYKDRIELLRLHFEISEVYQKVNVINSECNETKIIEKYLKQSPSAIGNTRCNECGHETTRPSPTIILQFNNSLTDLNQLFSAYIEPKYSVCKECNGTKKSEKTPGNHIFIETDIVENPSKLNEIPKVLNEK